ncbi:MAG: hypothetical protein IT257_04175, partial [Chitinophagaceae bacterium]|nr:hypothetical protein [Chitinophagaceae bacterium]
MRKFYKWRFLFYCLLFLNKNVDAQLNAADSVLFNSVFTSSIYIPYWNFPYKWYTNDSITSMQGMQNTFASEFPFTPSDMTNYTFKNIKNETLIFDTDLNASFNQFPWIYGQTNPIMKLPFMLNNKSDTAYTAFTPSALNGDCKTAIFLIHGNGVNTTTYLLQGAGYACTYCNVKNTCLQFGDVYTYCKPNEDWRAIYWNKKKLNDYAYNYCEAIGHNYGTNYLIETIALVKALKSKYERVIVMGLSEGGYTTLLNLLNTEPDGAVVAAGYSINFDIYLPSQFLLSNRFGNIPQNYTRDSVKARIATLQTNTLFTYGEGDNVELMDPEHDFHYTQNFLNNNSKCSFYYNFNTHTFPQCSTLDTFIQRIVSKPKALISPIDSVCSSDSLQLYIRLCGQAPFQYQIYRNDVLYATLNSNNFSNVYTLYSEGKYQVKNITDASGQPCINSETVDYKKDAPVGFAVSNKIFDCDSGHTEITLQLSGTSPWILNKSLDGNLIADTFINAANLQKYNNGELNFLQLTDSNHCSMTINELVSIHDSIADISISAPVYDCDSNLTNIQMTLQGRSPWLLQYKKNGMPQNMQISNPSASLYFNNGLYELISVTDSNQCQKSISQLFNFQFDSLHVSLSPPMYNCDSNKTSIQFSLQGNPPFEIHYTENGIPASISTNANNLTQYFTNGNYDFTTVSDATGCVKNINQAF